MKTTYNVVGNPTVMVFNAKGEQVDRTLGYIRTAEFISMADGFQQGIGTLATMIADEKKNEKDAKFAYKLGEKLTAWNRLEDADARFAAVVALDPENKIGDADDALLERAWICRKKENYDCAVAHSRDCLKRWPDGEMADDATIYVAHYSNKGGKKADALAMFKEYLKKWPQGEDADFAKEQIAELEKPADETQKQGGQ